MVWGYRFTTRDQCHALPGDIIYTEFVGHCPCSAGVIYVLRVRSAAIHIATFFSIRSTSFAGISLDTANFTRSFSQFPSLSGTLPIFWFYRAAGPATQSPGFCCVFPAGPSNCFPTSSPSSELFSGLPLPSQIVTSCLFNHWCDLSLHNCRFSLGAICDTRLRRIRVID